jgi:hypothetical glycosyl hydrolase
MEESTFMTTQTMKYNTGSGSLENWLITESQFSPDHLGKCETIFSLGNGYMGQRATTEERYSQETRNLFVTGTFNKFAHNEVTELPNAADVLWMDFKFNGQLFNLERGKIHSYHRTLNLKEATITREVTWEAPKGERFQLSFHRFISLDDLHVIGQQVEITPLDGDATLSLLSGINGQMTNSGAAHFIEGEKRLYDNEYLQMIQTTTESNIDFIFHAIHSFTIDNKEIQPKRHICMDRRQVFFDYEGLEIKKGTTLTIEKLSTVFTSRDRYWLDTDYTIEELKKNSLAHGRKIHAQGYATLLEHHKNAWREKVWNKVPITITSSNNMDQLAIRFAQYHLTVMTPAHDNRMNIGAKGFTGEGYKGHTFWDTEIFMLPYYTYTNPQVARSLLEYRYLSLPGAHKKAKENGYVGAMFPWESAWLDDGEVTPVWGAANVVTGESMKIWSGFIQYHITSDIAFATWQYYQITGDEDFMLRYGYELILDTAKFWASRLEWNEEKQEYHINDVIGPDEYKEHVDNNAFTNYAAHWNIKKAMEYYHLLGEYHQDLFNKLNEKLDLDKTYKAWVDKLDKIYLPQPGKEDLIVPQDDTYMSLETIDLTKYKEQDHVGGIHRDYNTDQVSKIQVSKQSDIMILFYLLEDLFTQDVKRANWEYYEPKTLHDSSLSLSTHCILANDLGDEEMAYELFLKIHGIDLGPNMKTSDHGIHAASLGGIWQSVVNGFGGVRMLNGKLRISPKLPKTWSRLTFEINWQGDILEVDVSKKDLIITKKTQVNKSIALTVYDKEVTLTEQFVVEL